MKNYTIEFYRFLTIMFIAIFHFGIQYTGVFHWPKGGYLGVEFFFMLSGFLLIKQYDNHSDVSPSIFIFNKIKRLYPPYLLIIIIFFISNIIIGEINGTKSILLRFYNGIWELLFLHDIGIPNIFMSEGSIWFLSSLVINSYFIYWLLSYNKKIFIGFISPMSCLLIFVYISRRFGSLSCQGEWTGVFYGAMIRSWADICLGTMIYQLAIKLRSYILKQKNNNTLIYGLNIIEIYALVCMFYSFNIGFKLDDFYILIMFSIIIVLSFINVTTISKLLNRKVFSLLGNLSYHIYLDHLLVSTALTKYFPNKNYYKMLGFFIIGSLLFSIFTMFCIRFLTIIYKKRKS